MCQFRVCTMFPLNSNKAVCMWSPRFVMIVKRKRKFLIFFVVGVVGPFFFFSFTQLWKKQIRPNTVATICGEAETTRGFGRHVLFVLLSNLRHN